MQYSSDPNIKLLQIENIIKARQFLKNVLDELVNDPPESGWCSHIDHAMQLLDDLNEEKISSITDGPTGLPGACCGGSCKPEIPAGMTGLQGPGPCDPGNIAPGGIVLIRQMDPIETRVRDLIASQLSLNKDNIGYNSSLIEDFGADSLDAIQIVMELEEEFDISIPDEMAEKVKTVGDIIQYIKSALCIMP